MTITILPPAYGKKGVFSIEGGERGNPAGENNEASGETSPTSLHSSPAEEDKLGFSFSDNGPSSIQGEGATSLFYEVGEWEKRGVTTHKVYKYLNVAY